jgi:hypothetical protein
MSRKTRPPLEHEELLDLPRHSGRWVPVPALLKISVCHECGNWMIRKGHNRAMDETQVRGHIAKGSIRFRCQSSLDGRPVCKDCRQAEIQMDQEETAEVAAPVESGVSNVA